ncbi:hypothetical protein OH77DRAFT_1518800 [Trametes cingulata]|nr:hypothetical protein OH77DRAFT_1518800 [Trametes cingulata]
MEVAEVHIDHLATLGKTLFAHTARLHTFLLPDAPYKFNDSSTAFFFAWDRKKQLAWLEEWEKHAGAPRKVAFTTEFVWRKTADGWAAPERRDEDSCDEDDEDKDEESDEESEGSVVAAGEERGEAARSVPNASEDSTEEEQGEDEDGDGDEDEEDGDEEGEDEGGGDDAKASSRRMRRGQRSRR